VVGPAVTLHNWHQEISRFVPDFKASDVCVGGVYDAYTVHRYYPIGVL
jgi:SNF2 family DNA or RNA helicase